MWKLTKTCKFNSLWLPLRREISIPAVALLIAELWKMTAILNTLIDLTKTLQEFATISFYKLLQRSYLAIYLLDMVKMLASNHIIKAWTFTSHTRRVWIFFGSSISQTMIWSYITYWPFILGVYARDIIVFEYIYFDHLV